jgi:3-isopropylmalate/(R)-2-methylmalate dehydratase small subunit
MILKGRVWKFGDNVDTDLIIPARYLNVSSEELLAEHCFEDVRPGFKSMVSPGDIIVAGKNFGCGSSREHAPIAMKGVGISCVIAETFARIFYRNSFNIGLPLIESPDASAVIEEGDEIWVNLETGEIGMDSRNKVFKAAPIPPFMQELIRNKGLVGHIRKKMQQGAK